MMNNNCEGVLPGKRVSAEPMDDWKLPGKEAPPPPPPPHVPASSPEQFMRAELHRQKALALLAVKYIDDSSMLARIRKAMRIVPKSAKLSSIEPFTLDEPNNALVSSTRRSTAKNHRTKRRKIIIEDSDDSDNPWIASDCSDSDLDLIDDKSN